MQKNVAFWMDCLSNVGQVHEFVQTNRLISNALLAFQLLLAREVHFSEQTNHQRDFKIMRLALSMAAVSNDAK